LAAAAAQAALKPARSLGQNAYKIAIARAAVERCILQAAGLDPLAGAGAQT